MEVGNATSRRHGLTISLDAPRFRPWPRQGERRRRCRAAEGSALALRRWAARPGCRRIVDATALVGVVRQDTHCSVTQLAENAVPAR
jgi:hypothetical protein